MKPKPHSPEWRAVEATKLNKKYHRRKRWIDKIKLRCGCVECGYNAHACALDFDHIDQSTKEFLIPRMLAGGNLKRLFREIRKCRVLCANCHRVHSRKQWDAGPHSRRKKHELALQSKSAVPHPVCGGHILPEVRT